MSLWDDECRHRKVTWNIETRGARPKHRPEIIRYHCIDGDYHAYVERRGFYWFPTVESPSGVTRTAQGYSFRTEALAWAEQMLRQMQAQYRDP